MTTINSFNGMLELLESCSCVADDEFTIVSVRESLLEKQARMLASSYNIRVVFKAGPPRTNGKTIFLPPVPDDAPGEMLSAVQGYLDHETGHVLFTDFEVFQGIEDDLLFNCLNAVEDIRMELRMIEAFPGSSYNLRNAHIFLYERVRDRWGSFTLINKILCAAGVGLRYADTDFYYSFVEPEVRRWADQVLALVDVSQMTSTADALLAAENVYELLRHLLVDEDRAASRSEDHFEVPVEGDSKQEGGAESPQGQRPPGDPQEAHGSSIGEELSAALDELQDDHTRQGKYAHGQGNDHTYAVYTTENDVIRKEPDAPRRTCGRRLKKLREEAKPYTRLMRTRLVNSLRVLTRSRWQGGKESGRLDTRRAYLGASGISGAVYKSKVPGTVLDTAVAIAIDHSGSMTGRPLELAAEASIVLGDVFHPLRVPFLVYGYSTRDVREVPEDATSYARWNGLWINIYKEFDEGWPGAALRLTTARKNSKYNTLDGESVKFGVAQLLARREQRKILIVINDGYPFPGSGHLGRCQNYLKNIVGSAQSSGVEIIAFGIRSSAVREYYPNYVIINELEDLIKEPLAKIDTMLRKGIVCR